MSTGCESHPGNSSVLLWRISLRDGKCGPMGYDLMLSRTSSIDCPVIWDVDNAVLMVFIWHSINLFDFG